MPKRCGVWLAPCEFPEGLGIVSDLLLDRAPGEINYLNSSFSVGELPHFPIFLWLKIPDCYLDVDYINYLNYLNPKSPRFGCLKSHSLQLPKPETAHLGSTGGSHISRCVALDWDHIQLAREVTGSQGHGAAGGKFVGVCWVMMVMSTLGFLWFSGPWLMKMRRLHLKFKKWYPRNSTTQR